MKTTSINWRKVRHLMIDKGIQSYAHLATRAGIHKNTLGREGPFSSTTLDKLATCLDCHPCDLIEVEETQPADSSPPPITATNLATRQRAALVPPVAEGEGGTPGAGDVQREAALEERRKKLLEQAAERQ